MELTIVQEQTFEQMLAKVATLRDRLKSITKPKERGLEDWLDSQDVCQILHISTRSLQTLRSNGRISFSCMRGKYYYHKDSVLKLINTKNKK
ncbi:MAG: helix-turn-helix domain-containing protein [Rikenellaceae bacterium]